MNKKSPESRSEIRIVGIYDGKRFHRLDPMTNPEAASKERVQRVRAGVAQCSKNLGTLVQAFRAMAGETRDDFASACGVTVPFVYLLESGLAEPQIDEFSAIAHHMGLSTSTLLYLIDPRYLGRKATGSAEPETPLE